MEKIKVLVVDDAAFMRDMIRRGLRANFPGFALDEAMHGKQAQGFLTKTSYDLVLCDWEMPEMSGPELLEWIRQEPKTQNVPFVMVTSRGDKEHVMKAIELKANNYIVKPFTTEKLITVVSNVLLKSKQVSPERLRAMKGMKADAMNAGSAAILTGQGRPDVGLSGAVPVAEHISTTPAKGGSEKKPPSEVRPANKVLAELRFSGHSTACLIKELSEERLQAVIRRGDTLPQILELAVFDVQIEGDEKISRINGYIHTLQARDDSSESEFINLTVRFVDVDDEDKRTHLRRYMASIA